MSVEISIDLDQDGKQTGFIKIPFSGNDAGYHWIQIPFINIRNGEGPRILCMGGNHGDEFEGQIIWTQLARKLRPDQVRGRLLIFPAMNLPAALAGTRVSPFDNGNLNRSFPGNPKGTPTERIAHIIETELIPNSDFLIDLHSGGSTMHFIPAPSITNIDDEKTLKRLLGILRAFGSPVGYIFHEPPSGDVGTIGACRRSGIERLGTELGGGYISPEVVAMGEQGVLRVLTYLGALDPALTAHLPPPPPMQILKRPSARSDSFIYAEETGLFDPFLNVGAKVAAGQQVGQILNVEIPWREPTPVVAKVGGVLIARSARGRTSRGDGIMVLADEVASH
jgi:predicted deacylase